MTPPAPNQPNQPLRPGKLPTALLSRLLAGVGGDDPALLVGPGVGRDAAAIRIGDRVLVAKSDPITFVSAGAAGYLIDVNANDIACLGARARWLLVTAMLPEHATEGDVEALFADLAAACRARGVSLVGGHTEVTPGIDRVLLVGTMLGETTADRLLPPGGARPGDDLYLTRGVAVEGTAVLANELRGRLVSLLGADVVAGAADLLRDPGISVATHAKILRLVPGVRALHDPTEGGLATGVREMLEAAGCGGVLERELVPVLPETAAVADALGLDPLGMLASGALLLAADPDAAGALRETAARYGIPLARVGRVLRQRDGFVLREASGERPLPEWSTDEVGRALKEAGAAADGADATGAAE